MPVWCLDEKREIGYSLSHQVFHSIVMALVLLVTLSCVTKMTRVVGLLSASLVLALVVG